jgi:hypothetical protein
MVETNPTSIVLSLHTINGERTDRTLSFDAPFHHLGPFEPMTIRSIYVGSRVSMYGNIIRNIEGANVEGYIHLRKGTYEYEKPFQLLTFHADIVD